MNSRLVTVKSKVNGKSVRMTKLRALKFLSETENFHLVPKKVFKRQQKDENRIRSRKQPRPFGAKLHERLAKTHGEKM
jgi:hypothetical protein